MQHDDRYPAAAELSTCELVRALQDRLAAPVSSQVLPPAAVAGEPYLPRSWLLAIHRRVRRERGHTSHQRYAGTPTEGVYRSLGVMLGFDADQLLASTDRREELVVLYAGLRTCC
jgi:predicted anti-sigma-YlaC factor YlaD